MLTSGATPNAVMPQTESTMKSADAAMTLQMRTTFGKTPKYLVADRISKAYNIEKDAELSPQQLHGRGGPVLLRDA